MDLIKKQAGEDFDRARAIAMVGRIGSMFDPENDELLSFHDVKSMLKPSSQSYQGMKTIPIKMIVGSEGRYKDFNKAFLPRREFLKNRWVSIDTMHLNDRALPPIKLYELGGVYFVADGNHRVSVAKMQGIQSIDAEVTSLQTEIKLYPGMTKRALKKAVIKYEKKQFFETTGFDSFINPDLLEFTSVGRYSEIYEHIQGHKYFLNMDQKSEISIQAAASSWYRKIFLPILMVIRQQGLIRKFRGRTEADLYVWVVTHWHYLKEKYGDQVSYFDAVVAYSNAFQPSFFGRIADSIKRMFGKH
jgi:hypothetical protein